RTLWSPDGIPRQGNGSDPPKRSRARDLSPTSELERKGPHRAVAHSPATSIAVSPNSARCGRALPQGGGHSGGEALGRRNWPRPPRRASRGPLPDRARRGSREWPPPASPSLMPRESCSSRQTRIAEDTRIVPPTRGTAAHRAHLRSRGLQGGAPPPEPS